MAAWSAPNNDPYSHSDLPSGCCNFSDLTRSHDAPKCPCRRFYINYDKQTTSHAPNQGAWCHCGHHACYHDQHPQSATLRQESRPSVPARSHYDTTESPADAPSQRQLSQEDTIPWTRPSPPRHVGLGLRAPSAQPGIWDALNAFQRKHAGDGSDRSSALPSTATPSVPTSVPTSQAYSSSHNFMRQVMNASHPRRGVDLGNDVGSATEINTPSIDGTPLLTRPSPNHMNTVHDSPMPPPSIGQHAQPARDLFRHQRRDAASVSSPLRKPLSRHSSQADDVHIPRGLTNEPSLYELQNIVKAATRRLDLLESLSYTHVPIEEVEDRFEQVEGRLVSLEDFRDHVESRLPSQEDDDERPVRKRRLLPAEATASFNSDDSLSRDSSRSSSSAVSATAAVYAEYNGRFQSLQHRVEALESALPSPSKPWRIEVVLLPWGRHLPGIWYPAVSKSDTNGAQHPREAREEWTGAHSTAHDIFGENASNPSGWSTDSIQAWADSAQEWLSPKACGPNGIIYQRLWSRGLVQNIDVDCADALSFMQQCKTAFTNVLQQVNATTPASLTRLGYDALREPLVPLRKVKKVSRLRFLAPSEMVSSALWTPAFLEAGVFMIAKGHQRRLYMTFPEAYIQQIGDGWTWDTIKALRPIRQSSPRTGPGFDGLNQKMDSEACWAHHATFDAPAFVDQSFASNASRQSAWSTKSQASHQTVRRTDPNIPSAMVSPISEARTLRDSRRRTISIPPPEPEASNQLSSNFKRRIPSLDNQFDIAKRRRTSNSSSQHARPGPSYTPRLSREPPSPFASDHPTSHSDGNKRVVTPLAYETPHSHTNNTAFTIPREGDGDTEADTDILGQGWSGEEWRNPLALSGVRGPAEARDRDGAGWRKERVADEREIGDFERYKSYRQQEADLDDDVDVGDAEEVLENLALQMRMSHRCRRHGELECERCPRVECRYSLRSARGC
ncbi:hypothetical protein CAC42_2942 [Sphaceloma murrayae]|uniref:Uncharacterized protein n=1 Tax=Sphaceloma murrayae TaxID=2082308 RepID=A0A2K1R083_9PEZI|nr:hypothetical protein CAC42_2942 [Sphaceloma murrayae]